MGNNVQKTPIARALEQFTGRKIAGALSLEGQSLPGSITAIVSSGIVTVKFEIAATKTSPYTLSTITVPVAGPEYIRFPLQVGCKGLLLTADAYLGGISGLGGGTADLAPRANLSALVFLPIGSTEWSASENAQAVVIYGPDGVIIRSTDKAVSLTVTKEKNEWKSPVSNPVTIAGNLVVKGNLLIQGDIVADDGTTYAGNFRTKGAITAGFGTGDAVNLQTHQHTQPNDSHGDAEQPTAAPTAGT